MMSGKKEVIAIRGRRELFLDDFLISSLSKGAKRVLHHPEFRDVVMSFDEGKENSNCTNYVSIVHDDDRYLIYYRAGGRQPTSVSGSVSKYFLCVAETRDGKNFSRCKVNLLPEAPNAVLNNAMTDDIPPSPEVNICPAVSTVFKDTNPACLPEERFKMLVADESNCRDKLHPKKYNGLYLFVSPDGFNFTRKSKERFALDKRVFYDTAHQAFFDHSIGEYRLYMRHFGMIYGSKRRNIVTCRTRDFVEFHDCQILKYDRKFHQLFKDGQQLYTNNIAPYFRAPHIMLGFPARYYDSEKWDNTFLNLPDLDLRTFRANYSLRAGTALTETVLITSRNGLNFKGFGEAFLRPGPQTQRSSWTYGDMYFASGMIPTASDIGYGAPDELSFYFVEAYGIEGCCRLRRCAIRMDGFASIKFPAAWGRMETKPFVFEGHRLTLNLAGGAFGRFKVGFLDEKGKPIPGYSLDDALPSTGDALDLTAFWKHGCDVSALAGKPVSMVIEARDCDLYSLQFVAEPEPLNLPELGDNQIILP
ncbi:MAG: hypothetical protein E7055_01170 [Lentisphaerae bacterium]|nr:hypothetical protein [Lentisphaerota bacterium]